MRAAAVATTAVALGVVVLLMTTDAFQGNDWPGWDEGWALVAFPLGVPLAVAAGLALSLRTADRPGLGRLSLDATLAVWVWGAAVFAVWHALG